MAKSAKGTAKNPGKNVKAKSALNRSILDQGWYRFQEYLLYKLNWQAKSLILIPPKNTSTECRMCHFIAKENRKTQAVFECIRCGHTEPADLHASINILIEGLKLLAAGHAVIACGVETVVSTTKQELPIRKPAMV